MPVSRARARRPLVCAACCLLVVVAACGSTSKGGQNGGDTRPAGSDEIVATVDGQPITAADLRKALGQNLASLETQIYDLKKQQLDELIARKLLAAEAARRGTTVEALERQEIESKVAPVTESDVAAFVAANRSRIPGDPAKYTDRIRTFLASQRSAAAREAFVSTLRGKARVDVRLEEPPAFRAEVNIDGAPVRGDVKAPVTIVEFSDFHCPYCRAVQPTLRQVLAKYPARCASSTSTSLSTACTRRHGAPPRRRGARTSRAGSGSSTIASTRPAPTPATPRSRGSSARRRSTRAPSRRAWPAAARQAPIQRDIEQGSGHGLSGTPGFFVNGRFLSGNQPLSAFEQVIDEELKDTR